MEDCIYYKDGRFSENKIFAFHFLSYVNRHTNSSQDSYYVKEFNKDFDCLEDLQNAVVHNDFEWINKLMYFSSSIKGYTGEHKGT